MKKTVISALIIIFLISVLSVNAFAAGNISVSVGKLSVNEGGTATFTITANNSTGRVDISSSNSSVATVSSSSYWFDCDSLTVTVKGVSSGTAAITVKLSDVATYDGDELSGSYTVNVTVSKASSGSSGSNSGSNSGTNSTTPPTPPEKKKSNDATLNRLEIEGFDIGFSKDKTEYELSVANDVPSLKVSVSTSNSAASYTLNGGEELKVGENTVTVNVTAEDGTQKTYTVKITRRDEIPETTLENLENTLTNTTKDTVILKIGDSSLLSKEVINAVRESGKNILINKYGDDGVLLYQWEIKNENITSLSEFNTEVLFVSENADKINELMNYAEAFFLCFGNSGSSSEEAVLKVYVGNKYKDGDTVRLYGYNETENSLRLVCDNLKVSDEYITVNAEAFSGDYIMTRSVVNCETEDEKTESEPETEPSGVDIFLIVSIAELLIIIGLAAALTAVIIRKKNKS